MLEEKPLNNKTLALKRSGLPSSHPFTKFLLRYPNPNTRRAYLNDYLKFSNQCLQWFQIDLNLSSTTHFDSTTLPKISEELVTAWLRHSEKDEEHLLARELEGRLESRSRLLACLSAYCTYLIRKKMLSSNPIALLPAHFRQKPSAHSRTDALNEDEMKRVLAFVEERPHDTFSSQRTQDSADLREVIIWTLLTVGMRVNELISLRICDFIKDGSGHRLSMTLKGGDPHDPYIHPTTAEKIDRYISKHRRNCGAHEPLFVRAQRTKTQTRLTQFGIFKMVQKVCHDAGIRSHPESNSVSPHSLRATLATALIRQNIPLAQVKDLLGHQSIQTTSIYLKRAHEAQESATLALDTSKLFGYTLQDSQEKHEK